MHTTEIRVIYGDCDPMGVVYYGNYLRYFEIGRGELMRSLGHTYRQVEEDGLMLPVTEASCSYRAPARYDDLLQLETRVALAKGARWGLPTPCGGTRTKFLSPEPPSTPWSAPPAGRPACRKDWGSCCGPMGTERSRGPIGPGSSPVLRLLHRSRGTGAGRYA